MPRVKAPAKPTREPLPAGTVLLDIAIEERAVLMALDCSSTAIGWSVWIDGQIRAADVIACPKSWDKVRRMKANAQVVVELIDRYGATNVVMEFQSHMKAAGNPHASGLATLGQAQGWLACLIDVCCPDVKVEYPSERDWTRWGGRNLAKSTRAKRVAELVPEYADAIRANGKADKGLDVADAIGIALWRLGRIE